MFIDRGKLHAGMYMLLRPGEASVMKKNGPRDCPPLPPNYVRINLGSRPYRHGESKSICEWAHRFICSCINGPPDKASGLTDVIHTCPRPDDPDRFGHPGCLNPLHMVYGKRDDNHLRGPAALGRFRRLRELAAVRRRRE